MRKIISLLIVSVLFFTSCRRTDGSYNPDGTKFVATLGIDINLKVNIDEIDASGVTTKSKDLLELNDEDIVAMKIYKTAFGGGSSLYAAGLFTGKQLRGGLTVELEHNQPFQICASIFRESDALTKSAGVYGEPFNVPLSEVSKFVKDKDTYEKMDLAGQADDINVSLGDRFNANTSFVADISKTKYTITAQRMAFKLNYNIVNYKSGYDVKIAVTSVETPSPDDVKERTILYKNDDDHSMDIDIKTETYGYPFIVKENNEFVCKSGKVKIVAALYHDGKNVSTFKKVQNIESNHIYKVNIDANPTASQGINILLEGKWNDVEEDVDLEKI